MAVSPFRSALAALLLVGAFGLGGCPAPIVHYASPDEFARALFRVARENDATEWGTLLTEARRALGPAYVREHFSRWRTLILEIEQGPFGGNLAIAKFRIKDGALEFESEEKWVHLLRVEMEDGGWKINQD